MSLHRENVTWQSPDGTWSLGFYYYYETGDTSDEDYDPEWDVEYTDKLHWVSSGHRTKADADASWRGANPGGGSTISYNADPKAAQELDRQAAMAFLAVNEPKFNDYARSQNASFQGQPKLLSITQKADELHRLEQQYAGHRLGGYSNSPDPNVDFWRKAVADAEKHASADELSSLAASRKAHSAKLDAMVVANENEAISRGRAARAYGGLGAKGVAMREAREAVSLESAEAHRMATENSKNALAMVSYLAGDSDVSEQAITSSSDAPSYHINPGTGRPNRCYATKRACPYGGSGDHYPSKAEARSGYEKKMGSGLEKLSKNG